jgi:2-keto-4-pentenoate hydratase/2-oxohepta-3-ene-1,7-dioic acid hydratase in catechol pathway
VGHPTKGAIWLKVNGETKQSSNLANMTWSVAEQVANLSQFYELFPVTSFTPARRKMSARWYPAT